MGPGPCNPYPAAVAGLGRPMLGHLDPEFIEVLDEVCAGLRTVFRTAQRAHAADQRHGLGGMEAAFVNVLGPGDVCVVAVNGLFGQRMVGGGGPLRRRGRGGRPRVGHARSTRSACSPPTRRRR